MLDNNAIVAKFTSLKDASSSASVARKSERTLASLRRESRTSEVTSWRKMMSGDPGLLRMLLRMSLQRETSLELRASTF